jgi:hypothetical protein
VSILFAFPTLSSNSGSKTKRAPHIEVSYLATVVAGGTGSARISCSFFPRGSVGFAGQCPSWRVIAGVRFLVISSTTRPLVNLLVNLLWL